MMIKSSFFSNIIEHQVKCQALNLTLKIEIKTRYTLGLVRWRLFNQPTLIKSLLWARHPAEHWGGQRYKEVPLPAIQELTVVWVGCV